MNLICVGTRTINLRYLIKDERGDGTPETAGIPPGQIRITLRRGEAFYLAGEDAESYRRQVDPYVATDPAGGESADPGATGVGEVAPLPARPEAGGEAGGQSLNGLRPQRG